MKKKLFIALLCGLMLVGCSSIGVSQEQYESVVAERDEYKAALESIKEQQESQSNDEAILEDTAKTLGESENADELDTSCFLYTSAGNGVAYISGYTGDYEELVLPQSIDGVKIVGIMDDMNGVFAVHDEIKSVVIPEGYEYIGSSAFRSCENLSEVEISSTVTSIQHGAFLFCNSLEEIYIPPTVTEIDENVFTTPEEANDEFLEIELISPQIVCDPGSYAEEYAIEYGYDYRTAP